MTYWAWILIAALAGGVLSRGGDRRGARGPEAPRPFVSDLVIALGVGLVAGAYYLSVQGIVNAQWLPFGQDNHEYLECALAARWLERDHWVGARYPLYAVLSASWSVLSGVPLWRAAMQVSLASSIAVPVAVYAFGRVFAAQPLALAGALLIVPVRAHLTMLATPNDYPLATVLYLLAFAALVLMVRDGGWRTHLVAGSLLALYFFTTPKAFPLTMLGAGAMVATQVLTRRLDLRGVVAFVLPLTLMWGAFSALDLPIYPLENQVYLAQTTSPVAILDPDAAFPDVGWTPDQNAMVRGYWVPGKLSALVHLPDTLKYLLFAPIRRLALSDMPDAYLRPVAKLCGFEGWPALVAVALLGVFGAWRWSAPRLRSVLAVGFALVVATVHLWGLTSADYADRWAFHVINSTPVMVLAAAGLVAGWRRRPARWVWLGYTPLLLVVGWMLVWSPSPLGLPTVRDWATSWHWDQVTKLRAILPLYDAVRPGDAVVDATENALGRSLLDGLALDVREAEMQGGPGVQSIVIRAPGVAAPRRWVILECMSREELPTQGLYAAAWQAINADTDRYRPLSRCIYEDLRPSEPIALPPGAPPASALSHDAGSTPPPPLPGAP